LESVWRHGAGAEDRVLSSGARYHHCLPSGRVSKWLTAKLPLGGRVRRSTAVKRILRRRAALPMR